MRVLRNRNARCKRPAYAGAGDLLRGHPLRPPDEFFITRCAQSDVVRKNHRPINVVMAVHGINAVKQRDFQPRLQRLILKPGD